MAHLKEIAGKGVLPEDHKARRCNYMQKKLNDCDPAAELWRPRHQTAKKHHPLLSGGATYVF